MKRYFVDLPEGQIHYSADGSGEPFLLLHQTSSSSITFSQVRTLFAKHYLVLAMDTPGFGDSFRVTEQHDVSWYASIAVRFLDNLGINRAHVLGHHTGASIACELAAAYPERVNKLILLGMGYLSSKEQKERLKGSARVGVPPNDWVIMHPDIAPREDGSHLMVIWNRLKTVEPDLPLHLRDAETAEYIRNGTNARLAKVAIFTYDAGPRLQKIKCPTLCISSDHDPEYENTKKAVKVIPHAQYACISNSGPHIHLTKAKEFAHIVLNFLKSS